jgi:hypothetical protein
MIENGGSRIAILHPLSSTLPINERKLEFDPKGPEVRRKDRKSLFSILYLRSSTYLNLKPHHRRAPGKPGTEPI